MATGNARAPRARRGRSYEFVAVLKLVALVAVAHCAQFTDLELLKDKADVKNNLQLFISRKGLPFNSGRRVVRMQSLYAAADLKAAGVRPGDPILDIGFKLNTKNSALSFGRATPVGCHLCRPLPRTVLPIQADPPPATELLTGHAMAPRLLPCCSLHSWPRC